jgi:drug/metabolite transporter (DMT)-like permease
MTDRQKGILALAIVLVAWCLSSVFVKYLLREGYDAHTQNFYRYAAGTLAVLPFLVRRVRRQEVKLNPSLLWLLWLPVLPNLAHQICWTMSLNWINPGLATFLNKSSILFAALMAFALYPDERWLLRSRRFLTGVALTIVGTLGLALLRGDLHEAKANLGVGLVLIAAVSWAAYSVAAKRPTLMVGSTVAFGIVGAYTTAVLFVVALRWGDLGHWHAVPWHVNAIMIGSGVFCIGIAHTLYYYAMRALTVSVCATMLLTTPLGTLLISHWLFKEQMTPGQLVAGLALIAGGALTLLAKEKPTPPEVAQAAEAADA